MYDSRLNIKYYCKDWPGVRLILYPDQVEKWKWGYHDLLGFNRETVQLYLNIDPDPTSPYHFILSFQFTQSMRDTILSLPTRTHISGTGKNTYQIPYYDLYPTMNVVSEHDQYIILVHNDIEGNYEKVVKEDDTIRDLATLTEEDIPELAHIRDIIDGSNALHPDFKLFKFQYAGVGAMLLIFGVLGELEVGKSRLRRVGNISRLSEPGNQDEFDFDSAIAGLIN